MVDFVPLGTLSGPGAPDPIWLSGRHGKHGMIVDDIDPVLQND